MPGVIGQLKENHSANSGSEEMAQVQWEENTWCYWSVGGKTCHRVGGQRKE